MTNDADEHIKHLGALKGGADTRAHYDAWAARYDAEMTETGYAAPSRAAAALAAAVADRAAPVLDIGCGTGAAGAALRDAGFSCIDGVDYADEMLARARDKRLYRALIRADLQEPLPFAAGTYANAAAVGVLTPAHAPPGTIDAVLALLPPGGCFVFSLSDLATKTRDYLGRIHETVDTGAAELMFREYGSFLPGASISADIYVLRRR